MRLFVTNTKGNKIYLDTTANSKNELAQKLGSANFKIGDEEFNVEKVTAESDTGIKLPIGTGVGFIIGSFIAPFVGSIIGGIGGTVADYFNSKEDASKMDRFNNSILDIGSIKDATEESQTKVTV